jgi:hypothetical protein
MVGVLIGRNEEELRRRESDLLDAFGEPNAGADWFEARRARWIHGTPDVARAVAARFADAGAERLMLQDFIARDLDMIDLAGDVLIG